MDDLPREDNNPNKPYLLFVEGRDEESFLKNFINDSIQIIPYHGDVSKLAVRLPLVIKDDSERIIKTIGIICDAEESKLITEKKLKKIIEKETIPIYSLVLPVSEDKGCLENLILAAMNEKQLDCAKAHLNCLYSKEELAVMNPNFIAKRLVYSIMSMTGNPKMPLGQIFKNDLCDFNHDVFKPIIKFISDIQEQPS